MPEDTYRGEPELVDDAGASIGDDIGIEDDVGIDDGRSTDDLEPPDGMAIASSEGADASLDPAVHPRYLRKLTPWFLFTEATITFRERFWRIWRVAAVVAISASLLNTFLEWLAESYNDRAPMILAGLIAGAAVLASGANSFGSIFLSGVLDKTVGEHQHGHRLMPLRQVMRTLPYFSLILADILVVLIRAGGLILFVIPGLIAVTLTSIVGPVLIIEERKAWSAIKRSAQLVRPYFWLVCVCATIPLILEAILEQFLENQHIFHTLEGHTIIGLFLEVPLITWVALVECTLAYHLIERDRPGSISAHTH